MIYIGKKKLKDKTIVDVYSHKNGDYEILIRPGIKTENNPYGFNVVMVIHIKEGHLQSSSPGTLEGAKNFIDWLQPQQEFELSQKNTGTF